MTAWSDDVIPLRRRDRRTKMRALNVLPPEPHHSDYFAQKWRGLDKKGKPLPDGHPWANVRREVVATFTEGAIKQIRAMGGLNPDKDFSYLLADRNQYIGWDGVVFAMSRKRRSSAIGEYVVGGDTNRKVRGTKFTVGSARIAGQYMSRVIFALLHTGTDPNSQAATEQEAVLKVTPLVGALTRKKIKGKVKQGLKGVLVDSVVRGQDLVRLQRLGYIVVNYPHAQSNPDGGPGKRLNPTRVEKSHLRTIARHKERTRRRVPAPHLRTRRRTRAGRR
jgi:hypothetical protein